MAKQKVLPSTQDHLDIEKISNNLVILKDGTVSIVLQTTAVNFDLLSEAEQDAKIAAFGQLLNSLTHSFQILIRTRKINIRGYLDYIQSFENNQLTPGLKRQMAIYRKFVQNLITKNEILDKKFYIVIPYKAIMVTKTNPMKQAFGKEERIVNVDRIIDQAKAYLYPKRDHVMKQLLRIGLQSHHLSTRELIEMFFEVYNPYVSASYSLQSSVADTQSQIVTQFKENSGDGGKQIFE